MAERGDTGIALVTGATGFVGDALVRRLLELGRPVRALVRDRARASGMFGSEVEIVVHDLTAPKLDDDTCRGVATVFHLAGHAHAEDEGSGRSDRLHQSVTVEGTRALLAAASAARVDRFIFLSSVKAIGESTGPEPSDGSSPRPTTAYGRAKLAAEALVLGPRADPPNGIVVRSPLVYGPNVKGNLRQMLKAISRRRFPPLPAVDNERSMVDVRDLVAALLLLETHERAIGRSWIATDGEAYSTRRIYEAMTRAAGLSIPRWSIPLLGLELGARAGDALERVLGRPLALDSDRLSKLFGNAHYSNHALFDLGFRPEHRLETTLPEMVAALRATNVEP